MRKRISVVMPAYNSEKYIAEAIDSILNQTFADFEFIIIDDGSTDRTPEIVRGYDDSRIKFYINAQNMGVAATLNRGLDLATGEYIARMDSDDISLSTRFEEQIAYMDVHTECIACGTDIQLIGAKYGKFIHSSSSKELRADLFFNSCLAHPTVMIRKSMMDEGGYRYDEESNGVEDFDLWYRLSYRYELGNINKILLKYRIHPNQVTQDYSKKVLPGFRKLKEKQLADLGITENESGYSEYISFCCGSNIEKNSIPALLALFERAKAQNKAKKIYDPNTFSGYIDGVVFGLLNRYRPGEAYLLLKKNKCKHIPYIIKRICMGVYVRIREKMNCFLARRRLNNRDFTIISNNCWGGIISEKYGLIKNSPTCGLLIEGEDYIKFCADLKHYVSLRLEFIPFESGRFSYLYPGQRFPVAKLGDIEIYFMHYPNEEIASAKWYRRCDRINWSNLIYKLSEKESFNEQLVRQFMELPISNKLCFSYDDVEGTVHIPELKDLKSDETELISEYFDDAEYLNKVKNMGKSVSVNINNN